MFELNLMFFAVAIPAVIFAGISKGGFGSGVAFASSSILALILTPGQALALMLPILMVIDVATLKPYWKRWSWPDSRLLILGAIPGVALGAWLYRATDDDLLRVADRRDFGRLCDLAHCPEQPGWMRGFANRLPPSCGPVCRAGRRVHQLCQPCRRPTGRRLLAVATPDKDRVSGHHRYLVFWVINAPEIRPVCLSGPVYTGTRPWPTCC